ncbi:MAG: Holliday junction resolvase RuvX [Puniceicoccales bacterium]|jgi:putative Holliday junction resolvase|nr:Holliday junction resolvase RuvX [Puniceicoccales bacterium]
MNYLGIDYGTKRVGLSVGDDALRLAVPIGAVRVKAPGDAVSRIREIVNFRHIHKIIVGYPLNMDDTVGVQAREVERFMDLLRREIGISVEPVDERLSSENVGDLRRRRSIKNRRSLRRKGAIDSAAAALILQDYFDAQSTHQ